MKERKKGSFMKHRVVVQLFNSFLLSPTQNIIFNLWPSLVPRLTPHPIVSDSRRHCALYKLNFTLNSGG